MAATVACLSVCVSLGASPVSLGEVGSTVPGVWLIGAPDDMRTGDSSAFVGDFNGDGFDDVLIGASGDPASAEGRAYLVYGTGATASAVSLESLASRGIVFEGIAVGDEAGFSVASAGDFNGDDFDDLLIGAPGADPLGRADAGEAYLIFGSIALPQVIDLANVGTPAVPGIRIVGRTEGDRAGFSVSFAGDMNGDGRTDVAVGAPQADFNGTSQGGEVYLLYGSATLTGTVDPGVTPVAGAILESHEIDRLAGSSVSTAGDFNGDGFDDLVIGGPGAEGSGLKGKVYLVCGCQFLTNPVNLDNVGAGVTGVTYIGAVNDFAGRVAAYAGDINRDGLDEVLVGAPNAGSGRAYLLGGQGFVASPASLEGIAAAADGIIFEGISPEDHAGLAVFTAGDVTGDGLDDLLIGAPEVDVSPEVNAGAAYLVHGTTASSLPATPLSLATVGGSLAGRAWRGQGSGHRAGEAVGGRGDFNSDGFEDYVIGASAADFGRGPQGGAYVIFGSNSSGSASPSYVRRIRAGNATPADFPPVRLAVDHANGDVAPGEEVSLDQVTLFRSAPSNMPGDLLGVLPVHWRYQVSGRFGATGSSISLEYTSTEIGDLPDTNIVAYTAPAATGPWTAVANQGLESLRRRVELRDLTFVDGVPLFIALGVTDTTVITAEQMADRLLGLPIPPPLEPLTDPNADGVEDAGDVVHLVNQGL